MMMGRELLVLLVGAAVLFVHGRPIDADFKPTLLDGNVVRYSTSEDGVLLAPSGTVESGSRIIPQSSSLIQESHRSIGDDDFIGGEGVKESPVELQTRPMSALIQEDESAIQPAAEPCIECLMNKIAVPQDFSGDLNELAEQAYEPDEELKREAMAMATPQDEEDDQMPQILKYGMRPGDELIGGTGRQDVAESQQINLETEEGISSPAPAQQEVPAVKHKTDVLTKDVLAKQQEILHLKQVVAQLQQAKDEHATRLQAMRESDDKKIDGLKKMESEKLSQLQEQYHHAVEELKVDTASRMERIKEEERNIGERKIGSQQAEVNKEREQLTASLNDALSHLQQLERQTVEAEERAEKLSKRQIEQASPSTDGNTVRTKWQAMREELQNLHNMLDSEESNVGELGAKIRQEQHARLLLDARLKNLHMREEAVMAREKNMEVANANLRHQLDKEEYDSENTVEMVGKARAALAGTAHQAEESSLSEAAMKERMFEAETMQAAQEEIARLKMELARKEKKEAHIGEMLLAQERAVQDENTKATQLAEQTRQQLDEAQKQVVAEIEKAKAVADSIVNQANQQAAHIQSAVKEHTMEAALRDISLVQEEQKQQAAKLMKEEQLAKEEGQKLREELKKEMEKREHELKMKLDAEEQELRSKIHAQVLPQLESAKATSEQEMTDLNADWVMAKIHADKDDKEIEALKLQHASLEREVVQLKKELQHQREEWSFQQAVSAQQ